VTQACLPAPGVSTFLPGSYAFSWSRPLAGNVGFRADVCRAGLVTYTSADLLT